LEKDLEAAKAAADKAAKDAADAVAAAEKVKAEHEQAIADREARLERERKTRELNKERLTEQLSKVSHAELVEILLDKGLTCLGEDLLTGFDILTESLDILERTFWVVGSEFANLDTVGDSDEISWDKYLSVPDDKGNLQVTTGVCSIGALALAKSLHDVKTQGHSTLDSYDNVSTYDWPTMVSGRVLANGIMELLGEQGALSQLEYQAGQGHRDLIIWFNDTYNGGGQRSQDDGRANVVAAWKKALDNPASRSDELWGWSTGNYRHFLFGSQEEAMAFYKTLEANQAPTAATKYMRSRFYLPAAPGLIDSAERMAERYEKHKKQRAEALARQQAEREKAKAAAKASVESPW
jgi:hypothetical protein